MIRSGEQIRLTPRERRVIRRLTGVDPSFIKTRTALENFLKHYMRSYASDAPEIRLIKALLREYLPP